MHDGENESKDMHDILEALERWYADRCNGVWEHDYGISIQSCDNPGWWEQIDLRGTGLESQTFERIADNMSPAGCPQGDRWLDCRIDGGIWNGAGDETKLRVILKTFLDWAGATT